MQISKGVYLLTPSHRRETYPVIQLFAPSRIGSIVVILSYSKKMLSTCILIFGLAAFAVGQSERFLDGPCPIKITGIEKFDHQKYLGKWLDVLYSSNSWVCGQGDPNCTHSEFKLYDEDRHLFAHSTFSYGSICSDTYYENDYDVNQRLYTKSDDTSIYILDTDYDSYAVEVSCYNDNGLSHQENVFIRSRTMDLDEETRNKLVQKVVDFGFAEPVLTAQDYSHCH